MLTHKKTIRRGTIDWRARQRRAKRRRRMIWMAAVLILLLSAAALAAKKVLFAKPKLTLNGEAEVTVEVFGTYQEEGAAATYKGQDISSQVTVSGEVDTEMVTDYTLTYAVTYRDQTIQTERLVHVVDTQAPVITLEKADETVSASSQELYEDPGYTAADNFDGNVTRQVDVSTTMNEDGTMTVHYFVTDQSGNRTDAERQVIIQDVTPPVITLSGDAEMEVALGGTFEDPGVSASDDLDGDLTANVMAEGSVDVYRTDTYTLTYRVSDQAGNEAEATRTVKVVEDTENQSEKESTIYLTFDDGPSTKVTEKILDILKENGVHATFFIINYDDSEIPLLQRMVDEGHTIGLHAYVHDYKECYENDTNYLEGLEKLKAKLKEDTGYEAYCIRFPGGSSNTVSAEYNEGVMARLTKAVQEAGWQYYDWNVDSTDAEGNNRSVSTLVKHVKSGLKKHRGNIVLCHDTNAKETTAEALQKIIDYGTKKGYQFDGIQKDTEPVHHSVNN